MKFLVGKSCLGEEFEVEHWAPKSHYHGHYHVRLMKIGGIWITHYRP